MSFSSPTSSSCSPKQPAELNEMTELLNFPSSSQASTVSYPHIQNSESQVESKIDVLYRGELQHHQWNYTLPTEFSDSSLAELQPVDTESPCLQQVQQEFVLQQIYATSYLSPPMIQFPIPDIGSNASYYRQYSPLPPIPSTPSTSHSQGTSPYWHNGSLSSTPTTPASFPPQLSFPEPEIIPRSIQGLTFQEQMAWWKKARELPAAGGNPIFIPQRIYKPHTTSDIKRYVEEVTLDPPIYFWMDGPEECGISLTDSLHGRTKRLRNRDKEVFEGRGPSVSIRLEWPGYRQWSRQIPTKDFKSPPRPISVTKLCKNVAKCVQRFIQV